LRRASAIFDETHRQTVNEAVRDAESRTSAEIVPAVATASGRYDRAEDMVGLIVGIGAMVVLWLLFQDVREPAWTGPAPTVPLGALVLVLVGGFALGAAAATRIDWLRRPLVPPAEIAVEVEQRAAQLFHDQRIHHTDGSGGVLVYLSLFERRAVILADRAAFEALGKPTLDGLCSELIAEARRGDLPLALAATIRRLGDLLAEKLPRADDDVNELPDAVVVID